MHSNSNGNVGVRSCVGLFEHVYGVVYGVWTTGGRLWHAVPIMFPQHEGELQTFSFHHTAAYDIPGRHCRAIFSAHAVRMGVHCGVNVCGLHCSYFYTFFLLPTVISHYLSLHPSLFLLGTVPM